MAQDYECFPREWYNEGFITEEDFDNIKEYWEMCEKHSVEAVDAFMDWGAEKLEHFEDCYLGEYDSEEDYARQYIADCYDLYRLMGSLSNYFQLFPTISTTRPSPVSCSCTICTTTTATFSVTGEPPPPLSFDWVALRGGS